MSKEKAKVLCSGQNKANCRPLTGNPKIESQILNKTNGYGMTMWGKNLLQLVAEPLLKKQKKENSERAATDTGTFYTTTASCSLSVLTYE